MQIVLGPVSIFHLFCYYQTDYMSCLVFGGSIAPAPWALPGSPFRKAGNLLRKQEIKSIPAGAMEIRTVSLCDKGQLSAMMICKSDRNHFVVVQRQKIQIIPLRGNNPTYSIRACRTYPSEPAVFHFKVLVYDK